MEKISIEVRADLAKAWEGSSPDFKKQISGIIEGQIRQALSKGDKEKVLAYLTGLKEKMNSRGLTQDALDDILR
jgi:hypothetical protein